MKRFTKTASALALGLGSAMAAAVTPGDFDPAFGTSAPGYTLTGHNDSAEAHDLVLYPDGSRVTSGTTDVGGTILPVLTRYLPNGALDLAFGIGGHAGPATIADPAMAYTQVTALRNQIYMLVPAADKLYVYNYTSAGVLNPAFGAGGVTVVDVDSPNTIVDIAMQRSRIIVAGRKRDLVTGEHDFVLIGLKSNGALDAGFGVGGIAQHSLNGGPLSREAFTGLAIMPDLRIVAGGRTTKDISVVDPYDFVVARFRVDGSIDAGFGITAPGFTQIDFGYGDYGRRVALYRNQQVAIAGTLCKTIDPATGETYCFMGTARVQNNGALDPSWNGSGLQMTDLGGDGLTVTDIVLDARERALVSTVFYKPIANDHYGTLTRFDFLGNVDPAFGPGGTGYYSFGYPFNGYHTVKLVDEKYVATCGWSGKEVAPDVFRYGFVVGQHYNF